jgi:hypothetical protein
MTRTTDDLEDKAPWQPLGAPIRPASPPPADKRIAPGVLQRPDGRLHTDLPLPKEKP